MRIKILVTGGAGYIGSHTVIQLLNSDYEVVILDNLSNSSVKVIDRINEISNRQVVFLKGDIQDKKILSEIFTDHKIDSVFHFAGLKSVGESEREPEKYELNNVVGSSILIDSMLNHKTYKLVFSSSATVYGDPGYAKCTENTPLSPQSFYGKTKLRVEEIIKETASTNPEFRFAILRYFNPIGAHASGKIGEDPIGMPNNLFPYIAQVAVGKREKVNIWGNDYPTPDGTGRRDYIHVEDLAAGHISALKALESGVDSFTVNIGTGNSYSVLEAIAAFAEVSGKSIPYEFGPRRTGDVAENYADASLAKEILGWTAKFDLVRMCQDSWRWQSQNPDGYR
jgi:UDP-glucose 4-epimerase